MFMEHLKSENKTVTSHKNIIPLSQGKLPPQAIDLEEAVLGAMMVDKKGLDEVIDILSPEVFYKPQHQTIFQAIQTLFNNSQPVDLLTIANQLKSDGELDKAGGDYYLIQLTQKVSSSAHIEHYSRVILQKFILRKLIEVSSTIIEESYEETTDVFDLLDKSENNLFEITNGTLKKSYESSQNLVTQAIEHLKDLKEKGGLSGIPSGFNALDQVTSGWQNSDLVILAARPGMGKTAFVLSMARNMAVEYKIPIGIFSLEMPAMQLIMRMIASETAISSEKLRKGNLTDKEWEQLYAKVKNIEEAPLFIDDTPALSVFDLRAKARRMVSQHGVKLLMIDYLQLMTAGKDKGNREQEISMISRSLKSIAKELNIPVIALSQLSRAVETRGGSKRPQLSDLRESGAIEQDADIVSFIYRPEYYDIDEWEDMSPSQGQAELIIAKHRNGSLEDVRLRFIAQLTKFEDLAINPYSSAPSDFSNPMMGNSFESSINEVSPPKDISESFDLDPEDDDDAPF